MRMQEVRVKRTSLRVPNNGQEYHIRKDIMLTSGKKRYFGITSGIGSD